MLNPRDGLEERDDIFSSFFFSNNSILLDITNIDLSYNYIKLINTTLSLKIPMGGVKFSWPVAREYLTEGSLSHGSHFLTEHRKVSLSEAFLWGTSNSIIYHVQGQGLCSGQPQ